MRSNVGGGRAPWAWVMALGMASCGPDLGRGGDPSGLGPGLSGDDLGGASTDGGSVGTVGTPPTTGGADGGDDAEPDSGDGPPLPPVQDCNYESTSFGQGIVLLDVPTGSPEVLAFTITGLPEPAAITTATLHFVSHDADHPGEEGVVSVNGAGGYDLPADVGWDNQDANGSIDVTGTLQAGINVVEFGAGSLVPATYYGIGDVRLEVQAQVDECEPAPRPPPKDAIPREIDFWDAAYQMRHNWVLRCDGFEYAYTAYADEHIDSDCDGLYAPDGSRRGTATFTFADVVPATYEIQIHSRHTDNRNPLGALFVVNGEGIRIDQRDDADFTTDIWGVRELGGQVTVVLDSSQESESDSVVWVRLAPVGG